MASRKTLVHETLTDSIDDQIAELRNRKAEMNRAADALVSADTAVADARSALKSAEEILAKRRAEIVALGVKPREISRILKEMRTNAGTDSSPEGVTNGSASSAGDATDSRSDTGESSTENLDGDPAVHG